MGRLSVRIWVSALTTLRFDATQRWDYRSENDRHSYADQDRTRRDR
jgi:hypothetical protein